MYTLYLSNGNDLQKITSDADILVLINYAIETSGAIDTSYIIKNDDTNNSHIIINNL